jgi:hypothetical protein
LSGDERLGVAGDFSYRVAFELEPLISSDRPLDPPDLRIVYGAWKMTLFFSSRTLIIGPTCGKIPSEMRRR